MSGPVEEASGRVDESFGVKTIEIKPGRQARVGNMGIFRVLPTKRRRTIGPWCFVDLMSPDDVDNPPPLEIGPHPHIGLSTVTWLFAGEVLHTDSLGTQQPILPGELNLMTSGRGIAHAEEAIGTSSAQETRGILGAQMWLAQPDATRDGGSAFQHLKALPDVELDGGEARLLIGELAGETSPAAFDHPAFGADLRMRRSVTMEVERDFEYGVVPIDRPVKVDDTIVEPGDLAVVPTGYETLRFETRAGPGRVLVVGGLPLGERVKMWWNFVARTTDEITDAWRDWQTGNDERFGPVPSRLDRIDAPRPPWLKASD